MDLPCKLGKYILAEKIANGGMAEIYRALYLGAKGFTKEVVIKRILSEYSYNNDFKKMLIDEANALVNLTHKNIVQIFELGQDDETLYISMEFVNGVDLKQLADKLRRSNERLNIKYTLFIIREILSALFFIHNKKDKLGRPLNIVHRDISPSNILISFSGEVKASDFGIAKGAHRTFKTTIAQVKGKYSYMSPEQALGLELDGRTDLYSVGTIFYELLTNKKLFDGENDFVTIEMVKKSLIPENTIDGFGPEIETLLYSSLKKSPFDRFRSAKDFLKSIDDYILKHGLTCTSEKFSEYIKTIFEEKILISDETKKSLNDLIGDERLSKKTGQTMALTKVSRIYPLSFWKRYRRWLVLIPTYLVLAFTFIRGDPANTELIREVRGSIAIDTSPSDTNGELTLNGIEYKFKTPYALNDLDVRQKQSGIIKINRTGFAEVVEKVSFDQSSPTYAKTFRLKPSGFGKININADPWGYVYIPKHLNGSETPITDMKIKAGAYNLKIFHQPTNTWLQKRIFVAEERTLSCWADFNNNKTITCK